MVAPYCLKGADQIWKENDASPESGCAHPPLSLHMTGCGYSCAPPPPVCVTYNLGPNFQSLSDQLLRYDKGDL